VLEYWTSKKKRLDQNQQFCLFERSGNNDASCTMNCTIINPISLVLLARQSLAWIKEDGDIYLSTHTNVGSNKEETLALLEEHNSFKVRCRFNKISNSVDESQTKRQITSKVK